MSHKHTHRGRHGLKRTSFVVENWIVYPVSPRRLARWKIRLPLYPSVKPGEWVKAQIGVGK